jgi:catechol 2,3-dioxygenase
MVDTDSSPIGIAPPGFRLPAATRIGRVRLQVSDLANSIEYYEKVLGLRVLSREASTAILAAHGDDDPLVELIERPGARKVPRRGILGLYHFAVLLPNRASLGSFIVHLAELGEYAGMSDHLVSEAVYLTDPDGLGIEVYADRPRDTWTFTDRQIAMAANPLDVRGLTESAAGKRWEGAPSGTRIGHVHFHVGDLDEAARFYHVGLGLDKIVWNYPGALFLSAGGYHHHVGVNTWAAGASPATDEDARLLYWEVFVPGEEAVDAVVRSIESAGFSAERASDAAIARDPWGIMVRVRAAT